MTAKLDVETLQGAVVDRQSQVVGVDEVGLLDELLRNLLEQLVPGFFEVVGEGIRIGFRQEHDLL